MRVLALVVRSQRIRTARLRSVRSSNRPRSWRPPRRVDLVGCAHLALEPAAAAPCNGRGHRRLRSLRHRRARPSDPGIPRRHRPLAGVIAVVHIVAAAPLSKSPSPRRYDTPSQPSSSSRPSPRRTRSSEQSAKPDLCSPLVTAVTVVLVHGLVHISGRLRVRLRPPMVSARRAGRR